MAGSEPTVSRITDNRTGASCNPRTKTENQRTEISGFGYGDLRLSTASPNNRKPRKKAHESTCRWSWDPFGRFIFFCLKNYFNVDIKSVICVLKK